MAVQPADIHQGRCYSNGEFGQKWTVWQVVELLTEGQSKATDVIVRFRVLVGNNRRKYMTMDRTEFASKVRYEVALVESTWHRVE